MKKLLCILLTALLVLALAACGHGVPGGTTTPPDELDPDIDIDTNIEATLSIAFSNDAVERKMIDAAVEGFQKTYPNVTFEYTPVSSYESTIMGDVASGISYDILWVSDSYVSTFARQGMLANLDAFIEESGFDTSLYYDSMMRMGQEFHNGSQYFMPRDYSKLVVYINKDIFEELKIDYTPFLDGWTWEEYLATSQALYDGIQASTNRDRWVMEAEFDWRIQMYGFTSAYGGVLIDESGDPVFDENAQKGLTEMQKMTKNQWAKFSGTTQSNFIGGKVAMRWQVRPAFNSYHAVLGDSLEVLPFPEVGGGKTVGTGTTGYGIGRGSDQKGLAWQFLAYMMSEEGQNAMSTSGGIVPSLISLAEDENAVWRTMFPGINHDAFIYEGTNDVVPDYYDTIEVRDSSAYDAAIANMLHQIMGNGMDVGPAVLTCQREIDKYLEMQGR